MARNRLRNHTGKRLADFYLNPLTFVGYRNNCFSPIQILIFWQERMIWMMEEGHEWGIRSLTSFSLDGKYLQLKYTLSIPEKISICLIRGRMESLGNVTFLYCSRPQVRDGSGWRKTENPRGDRLCWCCETYCTVILRYFFASRVISDVLWRSCFESYGPKDTRQAQMKLVRKLHLHIPHNAPYLPPKILRTHCFQSLLKRL